MDYEEKYRRAMLHIAQLESIIDRKQDEIEFYKEIIAIKERCIKCLV